MFSAYQVRVDFANYACQPSAESRLKPCAPAPASDDALASRGRKYARATILCRPHRCTSANDDGGARIRLAKRKGHIQSLCHSSVAARGRKLPSLLLIVQYNPKCFLLLTFLTFLCNPQIRVHLFLCAELNRSGDTDKRLRWNIPPALRTNRLDGRLRAHARSLVRR